MKKTIFLLLMIFMASTASAENVHSGTDSQIEDLGFSSFVQETEDKFLNEKFEESYEFSKAKVGECKNFDSDECQEYMTYFLRSSGYLFDYFEKKGNLLEFERIALDYTNMLENINSNILSYDKIVDKILASKSPALMHFDEAHRDSILSLISGGYRNLAYYYASENDFDSANKYLKLLAKINPSEAAGGKEIFAEFQEMFSKEDHLRIYKASAPLQISIASKHELTLLLAPLYNMLPDKINPNDSNLPYIEGITKQLFSDAKHVLIYKNLLDSLTRSIYDQAASSTSNLLEEVYYCSFHALVANILLNAKGYKSSVIMTADKKTLNLLDKEFFKDQAPPVATSNHVLNLVEIEKDKYVFFDLLNNRISEAFSLDGLYVHPNNVYYEKRSKNDHMQLYGHFLHIPDNALISMVYSRLAGVIQDVYGADQAQELVQKSLDLWSQNISAMSTKIGGLCFQSSCSKDCIAYNESIKLIENILSIYPQNHDAYVKLALVYLNTKEYDKSLRAVTRAIEIFPDDAYDYSGQANILLNLNRFEEAKASFLKAKELFSLHKDFNAINEIEDSLKELDAFMADYSME